MRNKRTYARRALSGLMATMMILSTVVFYPSIALGDVGDMGGGVKAQGGVASNASTDENRYAIYPIPQNITYYSGEFNIGSEVNIVAESEVDSYTKAFLEKVLSNYKVTFSYSDASVTGKTNILLGIKASRKTVDTYVTNNVTVEKADLFEQNDAYLLNANENVFVILGKDVDSVFYGVATLQMMFSSFDGKRFLNARIEDYATVKTRGFIEGFYGSWTFDERADLMKFASNYKMNSYVFAAKGDAYHRSKWAERYPDETMAEFKKLVDIGKETKVKFGWSVHLETFFNGWDVNDQAVFDAKVKQLTDKFDQLYEIGVRKFDILNDDFGNGKISNATIVTLLNRINTEYIKPKGCDPLSYCPKGYNKAWSGDGAELEAMKGLNEDINIFWTGDDVNWPVTQETVNFLRSKTNHAPDYWLNFPVNEHAGSGIFLGHIKHYARDNVTGLAAFHSNPSRYAYANEVGLYQLAALTWNNNNYLANAERIWESAFSYLQPEVKDAYLTIGRNISNAPNSGRVGNAFPESDYLEETLNKVIALLESGGTLTGNADADKLMAEFKKISDAVVEFRNNCTNKGLITDLNPWLSSLDEVCKAGDEVLECLRLLEGKDTSAAWTKLSSAGELFAKAYSHRNEANNVAKAGSKRIMPFVSKALSTAENKLTPILNPGDDNVKPSIYVKIGGNMQPDNDNSRKMIDGNETTYAGWQINQVKDDFVGLDFGRNITVRDISILQGQTDTHHDIFHYATLEYSEDGTVWNDVPNVNVVGPRITSAQLDIKARFVRYRLTQTGYNGKANYWTFIREFTVNKKEPVKDRIYTNIEALKKTPLTLNLNQILVKNLDGTALKAGEYVGIKLAMPVEITDFIKSVSATGNLAFEYSYNGVDWSEAKSGATDSVVAKYIRLINKSGSAVMVDIEAIGIKVNRTKASPKVVDTNLQPPQQGTYEDMFDGELSTFCWTNQAQAAGQYMTIDLGGNIDVNDVKIVTADGNPRFYNAEIQISTNGDKWEKIAEVVDDNSIFEVPYRYVKAAVGGKNARYLRIYITKPTGWYLKIHEIIINENATGKDTSGVTTNMDGDPLLARDGNLTSAFLAKATTDSYVEYLLSDNTNVDQISVVQGAAGAGQLYAILAGGKKEFLRTLNEPVSIADTKTKEDITGIRVEWKAAEDVRMHEVYVSTGASNSDDVGEYVEPIIEGGSVSRVPTNIAPGKTVSVSGTSDGNKNNVNDEDLNTKWDSNPIKGNGKTAWLIIDLGTEKEYQISKVVCHFHNLIFPTDYKLEIADTNDANTNWTLLEKKTHKDNEGKNLVDTIEISPVATGRYVRLFFNSLNAGAIGTGVGVKEVEIYGVEKQAVDKSKLKELIVQGDLAKDSLDYTVVTKTALKEKLPNAQTVYNDENSTQKQIEDAINDMTVVIDGLEKKISEQEDLALKKPVNVSGTSNGKPSNINDGDPVSKWDSDRIKGTNKESDEAWFTVDLGEKINLIENIKVDYFNKVYPTEYFVEISMDGNDWIVVKSLTREDNGPTYPKDDIIFDTPVYARHIRMRFIKMNSVAAGDGVGITDMKVLGRYVNEVSQLQSVTALQGITIDEGETIDTKTWDKLASIKILPQELTEDTELRIRVDWDASGMDFSKAGIYKVPASMSLGKIENARNVSLSRSVEVRGLPQSLNYHELKTAIKDAEAIIADMDSYEQNDDYNVFIAAYNAAKAKVDNAASQDEIDATVKALKDAMADLKKKDGSSAGGGNSGGGDPGGGDPGGGDSGGENPGGGDSGGENPGGENLGGGNPDSNADKAQGKVGTAGLASGEDVEPVEAYMIAMILAAVVIMWCVRKDKYLKIR